MPLEIARCSIQEASRLAAGCVDSRKTMDQVLTRISGFGDAVEEVLGTISQFEAAKADVGDMPVAACRRHRAKTP